MVDLEKKDIALQQLIDSVILYKERRYCSALTLAAAAEEIFGQLAKRRTGTNQLEGEIIFLENIYKSIYKLPVPSKKELVKNINQIKNEFKHNDQCENTWVDGDFQNEYFSFFTKAVKNYFNAYNEFPKDETVRSLFEDFTL